MRSFAAKQVREPARRKVAPAQAARSNVDLRRDRAADRRPPVADSPAHSARDASRSKDGPNESFDRPSPRLGWDFGSISLQPSAPAAIQTKLAVNRPGDAHEQEADRVADQVVRMAETPSGPSEQGSAHRLANGPAMRISSAAPAVQRDGVGSFMKDMQDRDRRERAARKAQYRHFVDLAKSAGMPTKFLTSVIDVTDILHNDEDNDNHYDPNDGTLALKDSTLQGGEKMMDWKSFSSSNLEVQAIYHESTHAYLYQHRNQSPVKDIYEHGMKHYEGTQTTSGTVDDTEHAFQEAAAVYVGNRASAWFFAFWKLNRIALHKFNQATSDVQEEYDKAMSERIVGYIPEGRKQPQLKSPISDEMKTFLDTTLLEGKIPDHYANVPVFKAIETYIKPVPQAKPKQQEKPK